MSWSIHHVNLEAKDVRRAARFYETILGMTEVAWTFPPARGYIPAEPDRLALFGDRRQSHTGLHLIKADPDFARRNNLGHNPSVGGHVAIEVDDLEAVLARLRAAGIPYSDAGVFAIPNLRNVYVEDPEGNLLEINQRV
ncbi:VOC family protein [Ovoidimarina sediminis]|uniref:VOC family protein n=1 Tax=Ovoidimarina sediminis TaxID=3079856 RepID=UPI002912E727|nr:VOC family protein [Rhodophyticola sp. MJ-SS7]MDU8942802.1 VOC family protein [Rhodophyticola sp. MJ-SS7]